jgi:hypothetical protein
MDEELLREEAAERRGESESSASGLAGKLAKKMTSFFHRHDSDNEDSDENEEEDENVLDDSFVGDDSTQSHHSALDHHHLNLGRIRSEVKYIFIHSTTGSHTLDVPECTESRRRGRGIGGTVVGLR